MELTNLRVFSEKEFDFLGRCHGFLLIGVDEETAETFYRTPCGREEEVDRLLNARYAELVAGTLRHDDSRVEGLTEFDNLRALCAERNQILDELAENEAYPQLVASEDVLLEQAFGEAQSSLLVTLIERSRNRLFAILEDTDPRVSSRRPA